MLSKNTAGSPFHRRLQQSLHIFNRFTLNEDTGFAVLKVKAEGHRDVVTVVGSLPSVSAGEWLTAQGRWFQDREYGQQFKAEMLASTPPTTKEGIEKYLGSGMVKGIGPVYAKQLVEKFGEGVLDIIEKASARLEDVDGIGPIPVAKSKPADGSGQEKFVRWVQRFHRPIIHGFRNAPVKTTATSWLFGV
jgi:exodeoxyribonuclease V alpha subunit